MIIVYNSLKILQEDIPQWVWILHGGPWYLKVWEPLVPQIKNMKSKVQTRTETAPHDEHAKRHVFAMQV